MPDEHICAVFRSQEDIDCMREFTHYLRTGGMNDLRYISSFVANMKAAQKTTCGAIIVLTIGGIGAIITAGVRALLRVGQ